MSVRPLRKASLRDEGVATCVDVTKLELRGRFPFVFSQLIGSRKLDLISLIYIFVFSFAKHIVIRIVIGDDEGRRKRERKIKYIPESFPFT